MSQWLILHESRRDLLSINPEQDGIVYAVCDSSAQEDATRAPKARPASSPLTWWIRDERVKINAESRTERRRATASGMADGSPNLSIGRLGRGTDGAPVLIAWGS
ncbi:hypothetical protein CGMCC3_g745 [Colletotrichum fructicola]|nr:uncharacterized protein CGMCC3_g745 [Colletotrichum fructicola]KAE9583121.1 hypothetical protein CGMCC3_g745 [Colletotrichum fructicola]